MKSINLFLLVLIGLLVSSCASTKPPAIFIPREEIQVSSFYRNGLPIGTINGDSSFIMISMEPVFVSGSKYMRLWFLYKNNSSIPFLLEPLKAVKLHILGEKKSYPDINPESPTKILARIENEKATQLILQAIGGTLEALSTQPTTITNRSGEEWKANDQSEKAQVVTDRTISKISTTAQLYNIFKNSMNTGILRRNTIFSGESANGYIYFPLVNVLKDKDITFENLSRYKYKLYITTPYGDNLIEFEAATGE